ncbi:MAG: LLM class flavin-dependent oxidoreductase [Pseudochelatococcus sp.]|jgi:FMN-dependent oxidoreductase (nitrilotriacetate monooxygenase family)|uniref:LLM class flavin-dependent oxidoreductase n=1 Tax=Pseudochelatococcus sp. TaxID=2020869 RepID=UPI003D8C3EE3
MNSDSPLQLRLGLALDGSGFVPRAWLNSGIRQNLNDIAHIGEQAGAAARGLFDLVILSDGGGARLPSGDGQRLDPVMTAAALASVREGIGFVAQVSPHHNAPYTAARMLASIDHISGGRGGWLLNHREADYVAGRFGADLRADPATEAARTAEFIAALEALLDSWEDDAFIRDKESGIFFDRSKVHFVDFEGRYFRTKGPLDIARPIQGRLPLFIDGDDPADGALIAAHADVVLHAPRDIAGARAFRLAARQAFAEAGHDADTRRTLSRVSVLTGRDATEVAALRDAAAAIVDPHAVIASIAPLLGEEPGQDLDRPIPPLAPIAGDAGEDRRALAERIAQARQAGHSLARLASDLVAGETAGRVTLAGPAAEIAAEIEDWVRSGASDGFVLALPALPAALEAFVTHLVPALQRRGIYRTARQGRTLREQLGLPRSASRFAASA